MLSALSDLSVGNISVLSSYFYMLARIPSYSCFWVLRISTYFSAKKRVFVVNLLSAFHFVVNPFDYL